MANRLHWNGPMARPLERGLSTGQSRPLRQVTTGRWPKRPYGRAVADSTDLPSLRLLKKKAESVMGHQRQIFATIYDITSCWFRLRRRPRIVHHLAQIRRTASGHCCCCWSSSLADWTTPCINLLFEKMRD